VPGPVPAVLAVTVTCRGPGAGPPSRASSTVSLRSALPAEAKAVCHEPGERFFGVGEPAPGADRAAQQPLFPLAFLTVAAGR
jgi:hypothetical protein